MNFGSTTAQQDKFFSQSKKKGNKGKKKNILSYCETQCVFRDGTKYSWRKVMCDFRNRKLNFNVTSTRFQYFKIFLLFI